MLSSGPAKLSELLPGQYSSCSRFWLWAFSGYNSFKVESPLAGLHFSMRDKSLRLLSMSRRYLCANLEHQKKLGDLKKAGMKKIIESAFWLIRFGDCKWWTELNQKTIVLRSLFFLPFFIFWLWEAPFSSLVFSNFSSLIFSPLGSECYSCCYPCCSYYSSMSLLIFTSSVIVLYFLLAPDHSRPDPGMAEDRRSMMGAGLIWGKTAYCSSGCKKALSLSFWRYSWPRATALRVYTILLCCSLQTTLSMCVFLSFLHLFLILDLMPLAIVEVERKL